MVLASAQINPKTEDIQFNLLNHYNLVDLASQHGVDLLVFPEMSLTGYEREKACQQAFTENDQRLDQLRQLSVDKKMILMVGAPIRIGYQLYIGQFILKPDHSISFYTKQFLHEGEQEYFSSSFDYNPVVRLDKERISIAICADIDNPLHAENAKKNNTTIYVASIFFTSKALIKC